MKLPWRQRPKKKRPKPVQPSIGTVRPSAERHVEGFGNLEDFRVLRHHAVRALCGFLMDRHSSCRSPHPFCNVHIHHQGARGEGNQQFIADVIPQTSPGSRYPDIIAIYLARAKVEKEYGKTDMVDPMDYLSRLIPFDPVPTTKLVVQAPVAGVYPVMFGPIDNPVQGDYSTGRLDRERARLVNDCNPEPKHCRWTYWEFKNSGLNSKGQLMIPRLLCIQVNDEWWIAEGHADQPIVQQVAGLEVADSPSHNFGIHTEAFRRKHKSALIVTTGNSEYSKILRENLPTSQGGIG